MTCQITGEGPNKVQVGSVQTDDIADLNVTPEKLSQKLTMGSAVTCAGQTNIDFTGIPIWAKRITVMFSGVSTNGTSLPLIQLGTSGGFQITNYLSSATYIKAASGITVNGTTGFPLTGANAAASSHSGTYVLTLLDSFTGTWSCFGVSGTSNDTQTGWCGGSKVLSGALDRVRITTVNGTDTFDITPSAGVINIMYEG